MRVLPTTAYGARNLVTLAFGWIGAMALAFAAPAAAESGTEASGFTNAISTELEREFDAEFGRARTPSSARSSTLLPSDETRNLGPTAAPSALSTAAPLVALQGKALLPPQPPKPFDARIVLSQFVDIPAIGDANDTARYSGRADAYVNIGGSNFGLDDSWQLTLRPEFTWGETSNGLIGLLPNNTALFRPENTGDFDLSASVSKRWNSGTRLTVGKINILDISGALPVLESDGHFGFENLGLTLPPTGIAPNTVTGAMLDVPTKDFHYRFWVLDPDSQYGRTGFETAFESGVAFLASAAYKARIGNLPGFYNVAIIGSTRDSLATDILPSALTPPPQPIARFGNESGELAVQLSAYQFFKLYPEAPGKGWAILSRFQASRGDPTFLDYSGYFGVTGNPRKRPQDRFGLVYFHYSLTDELVEDIDFRLPLEDEQGVEVFYTLGVHRNVEVTLNAQLIDSAIESRDTGVIVGLRFTVRS